ncbi:transglutaminase family protein [Kribbella sp. NPDC051770]|uniref:transglutaminase-like domain-containing protein n=1 Tax=Kribbella sp. NPDC051770 TaxID=3155413 RepID=UPI00342B99EF
MNDFLAADDVIDATHPAIVETAARLRRDHPGTTDFACAAFEFTRDEVKHSMDVGDPRPTVAASEVLAHGAGLCHGKAHLLTALLRAEGVPSGICYQRLADGKGGFFLHGMTAVQLDGTWYRQDPRGDKPGVTTEFSLTGERLAYRPDPAQGEADIPGVFATADPGLVAALRSTDDVRALVANGGLPGDVT